tara:strand:+ start:115 stop:399 length:285 start_codon:yes stop_codon:yes gene_type:complete
MNKLLNLFFVMIFSVFLFYWFQNIIKKKKKYLYVPYSSELNIQENTEEENTEEENTEEENTEENIVILNNTPRSINIGSIIERNNQFENFDNYL